MSDIFGEENAVATVIWEKADSPRNSARQFSEDHDFILVYSKNPTWVPERLPRTEEANSIYSNPDNDPRGPWLPSDPYANHPYSKGQYSMTGPTGRVFSPPAGRYWRISEEKLRELDADGRIWWGPNQSARPSIKRYLSEVSNLVPRTLWKKENVGSNRTSKNEMRDLFPDDESFDTPKPTRLIEQMLRLTTDTTNSDIVIDFFAGSGTTAHSVLNLNKQDGGNRKFLMVQLPEPCNENVGACKTGHKTISDISKERIRRVIKKINSERTTNNDPQMNLPGFKEEPPELDLGFKVFKLDRSNFKIWDGSNPSASEDEIAKQLTMHVDHVLQSASQEDILYELLLKSGFMPTEKVAKIEMAGKTVFSIADGALLICLEDKITRELIDDVAKAEPMQFICLDRGFSGNDQLKANAVQTFAARNQGRDKAEQIVFRTV
jgi:adenine-specific DNA-methyltransferase